MADLIVAVIRSPPAPGDLERSVRDHVRLAAAAAHQGARIALIPELSLAGYDLGLAPADALPPRMNGCKPCRSSLAAFLFYSWRKASTGFALAAFAAVPPTVTQAIHNAMSPLPTNISGVRSIRYAKFSSQRAIAR